MQPSGVGDDAYPGFLRSVQLAACSRDWSYSDSYWRVGLQWTQMVEIHRKHARPLQPWTTEQGCHIRKRNGLVSNSSFNESNTARKLMVEIPNAA